MAFPYSGIVCAQSFSPVRLFASPWTVTHLAPLSMGFSRQEYWSGLPFPSPEDLSNPRIKLGTLALQADSLLTEPPGKPQMPSETHLKSLPVTYPTMTPGL